MPEKGSKEYWLEQQQKIPSTLRRYWNPSLLIRKDKAIATVNESATVESEPSAAESDTEPAMIDKGIQKETPEVKTDKETEKAICKDSFHRKAMVLLLEKRLVEKISDSVEAKRTAVAVERLLFKTAKSEEIYRDVETLDKRLGVIMAALMKRKARKVCTLDKRIATLRSLLGEEMYEKGLSLVNEVARMRVDKVLTTNCWNNGSKQPAPTSVIEIPTEIRRVFFQNKLTQAWQSTPAPQIASVPWKQMILETEEDIRSYKDWSSNNSKPLV